jgi:hypothetical protein
MGNRVTQEMQGRPDGRRVRRKDLTQGPEIYDNRSSDVDSCVSQSGQKDLACEIWVWWLNGVHCKAGKPDGFARPSCQTLTMTNLLLVESTLGVEFPWSLALTIITRHSIRCRYQ